MTLIGAEVRRKEDLRLLAGQGDYADDLAMPGACHVVFVRSPHAHARLTAIDAAAASQSAGVLAVLTGRDLAEAGIGPIPHAIGSSKFGSDVRLANRDGSERARTDHPPLAIDRVRFVGEAVAAVVAETKSAALDAAELVEVDYDELPAVTDALAALQPDAPQLWDHVPGNLGLEAQIGDRAATDAAFATAAHRVRFGTWVHRVTGVHMEPRSAAAWYDAEADQHVLRASGGAGIIQMQEHLAASLCVDQQRVRITAPGDVGGNFGTRNATYPEWIAMVHAARLTGRTIRHVPDRSEAFLSDFQARDLHVEAELALDAEGRFLAFRCTNTSNIGAHTLSYVPLNKGIQLMTSLYHVPHAAAVGRAVLTNTPPTIPYRSAGRPEAMFVIERIIDLAARQCGFDRFDLRRRNMIPADRFPYTNPFGITYDNGDHIGVMDQALALADPAGLPARRAEARTRGRYRGLGLGNYIEAPGGFPRERAEITVRPDARTVEVILGTQDTGQGHRTAFAQLVAEWLGLTIDEVEIRSGDTAFVSVGGGSHSGRSLRFASIVMDKATTGVVAHCREVFAILAGVDAGEVEFQDGHFRTPGANVVMHLFEVADAAESDPRIPEALRGRVQAVGDEVTPGLAFPYGTALCELEVDPETGGIEICRYVSIDDVGRALNPMIVHGQTHGGIVQGLGQAMFEACVFEPGTGQVLTGTMMDYGMPRAGDVPFFTTRISEVPAASHPMGFRPGGEGGTTPALGVLVNALADALADLGVDHIEMPATPLRVWQAIRAAGSKADG